MKYFKPLDLPVYGNAEQEFYRLLDEGVIAFDKDNIKTQICLNTIQGHEKDYWYGNGSLFKDFSKKTLIRQADGSQKEHIPDRDPPLNEENFTILCEQFKGTMFENMYNDLKQRYKIGRVRFMLSNPKTCLSWHTDSTDRIHYPIKTTDQCRMVIEDEVHYMPADTWWHTKTAGNLHTAFNGSNSSRLHLVCCIM